MLKENNYMLYLYLIVLFNMKIASYAYVWVSEYVWVRVCDFKLILLHFIFYNIH